MYGWWDLWHVRRSLCLLFLHLKLHQDKMFVQGTLHLLLHFVKSKRKEKIVENWQILIKGCSTGLVSYLEWVWPPVCHAPHATAWCGGSSPSPPTMPCRGLLGRECSCPGWCAASTEEMKTRSLMLSSTEYESLVICCTFICYFKVFISNLKKKKLLKLWNTVLDYFKINYKIKQETQTKNMIISCPLCYT